MSEDKIVITIGRQYGSGGHEVGEVIAKKLGIKFYDVELFRKAAEDLGSDPDKLKRFEERRTNTMSVWGDGDVSFMSMPRKLDLISNDDVLFARESELIEEAAKESCVIVGHCANEVLTNAKIPAAAKVFVYAPVQARIERVMEEYKIPSLEEAEKAVEKMDKTRRSYYQYFTEKRWGGREGYDLMVDSSILGIEKTADLIISFTKKRLGQ